MTMQLPKPATTTSPSPPLNPSSSILIIGAGTWGLSTALHLARRGHTHITVLDPYEVNPSPIAAGNDINKILELSSTAAPHSPERIVNDLLADAAVQGWKTDDVFRGLFHETGVIVAASSEAGLARLQDDDADGYTEDDEWEAINDAEGFRACMPQGVLTGDFPGWKGWIKRSGRGCGWVEARHALIRVRAEAERLGVVFVTGERGRVLSLVYEDGDVRGAVVAEGPAHRADHTVLAAGANAPQIMDLKNQLRPTAWTLAHIKLTPDEAELYRDLPVLFNVERGFFMEPNAQTRELKICDEHPGYCNWETAEDGTKWKSMPFAHHQIPRAAEDRVRLFLRETMPHLAERELVFARICWCADTPDRKFLISRHPEFSRLVLAVGDSGHGFSYVPAIGGVIADCLEGTMHPLMKELYRWRPETAVGRDWAAKQGRFGPQGSNHVMDFQKVNEWTEIGVR